MQQRTTWPKEYDFDGLLSSDQQVKIRTSSTLPPLPYSGRTTFPSEGWAPLAACLQRTEDMFAHRCNAWCHKHQGTKCIISDRVAYAKGICAACPVLAHCRIWSIESELECGVTGGLTEAERRHFTLKYASSIAEQLAFWDNESRGLPLQEPTSPVKTVPTKSILGQVKLPL